MAVANTADLFNQLFTTFTSLAILVAVVVFGLMAYLLIKFRARPDSPEPEDAPQLGRIPQPRGHLKTVVVSVTLSSLILGVLIFGTLVVTNTITTIPAECIPKPGQCVYITVRAFRFGWNFTYANGVTLPGNLTIPTGRIVVLEITSSDVFHSFGIDDFKVKKDAIPGLPRPNIMWFKVNEQGVHIARCFELCGVNHAGMTAKVSAIGQSSFQGFCSSAGC